MHSQNHKPRRIQNNTNEVTKTMGFKKLNWLISANEVVIEKKENDENKYKIHIEGAASIHLLYTIPILGNLFALHDFFISLRHSVQIKEEGNTKIVFKSK